MRLTQCLVKEGGLLFLSVPVGADVVAFNLHRRYGPARHGSALLLVDCQWMQAAASARRVGDCACSGWHAMLVAPPTSAKGWSQDALAANPDYRKSYEPVFVLRNSARARAALEPAAPHSDL